MRRGLWLIIPLVIAAALAVAVAMAVTRFPVAARLELQQYLAAVDPQATMCDVARAGRPWLLDRSWGYTTFGGGGAFQTDFGYTKAGSDEATSRGPAAPILTPAGALSYTLAVETTGAQAELALPFPPEEVWCVRLAATRVSPAGQIVLLARHVEEPYQNDWVIHTPPQPTGVDEHRLAELGCHLDLSEE